MLCSAAFVDVLERAYASEQGTGQLGKILSLFVQLLDEVETLQRRPVDVVDLARSNFERPAVSMFLLVFYDLQRVWIGLAATTSCRMVDISLHRGSGILESNSASDIRVPSPLNVTIELLFLLVFFFVDFDSELVFRGEDFVVQPFNI